MQKKTTVKHHHIPIRMSKIQNTANIKYWQGYGATETLKHSSAECKMVQPTRNTM